MFFKKNQDLKNSGELYLWPPRHSEVNEVVSCAECSCLVRKMDAHSVEVYSFYIKHTLHYCKLHKKPFHKKIDDRMYGEVEVRADGTPVGYVKESVRKSTPDTEEESKKAKKRAYMRKWYQRNKARLKAEKGNNLNK